MGFVGTVSTWAYRGLFWPGFAILFPLLTYAAVKFLLRRSRNQFDNTVLLPEYEYVVVGAGNTGCVVASRLAEAGHTVLLLEVRKSPELFGL